MKPSRFSIYVKKIYKLKTQQQSESKVLLKQKNTSKKISPNSQINANSMKKKQKKKKRWRNGSHPKTSINQQCVNQKLAKHYDIFKFPQNEHIIVEGTNKEECAMICFIHIAHIKPLKENLLVNLQSDYSELEDFIKAQHAMQKDHSYYQTSQFTPGQMHKLHKYFRNRYQLFSKFDSGIRIDLDSLYGTTAEPVASHIAARLKCNVIVDASCGVGPLAFKLAKHCKHVIANDISAEKITMMKHNAAIYNVDLNHIVFTINDFLQINQGQNQNLIKNEKIDICFLSPPWGGIDYSQKVDYDLINDIPGGLDNWIASALGLTQSIAIFLPRNMRLQQLIDVFKSAFGKVQERQTSFRSDRSAIELEIIYLGRSLKGVMVYYGRCSKVCKSVDCDFIYKFAIASQSLSQHKIDQAVKDNIKREIKEKGMFAVFNSMRPHNQDSTSQSQNLYAFDPNDDMDDMNNMNNMNENDE